MQPPQSPQRAPWEFPLVSGYTPTSRWRRVFPFRLRIFSKGGLIPCSILSTGEPEESTAILGVLLSIDPIAWHTPIPKTPTCERVPHCCGLINLMMALASHAPRLTRQFLSAIRLRSSSSIHLTALLAASTWIWTWPTGRDSRACGRRRGESESPQPFSWPRAVLGGSFLGIT